MRRETRVQLVALGCMVVFLGVSATLSAQIAASTGRNRLVYADKAEAGDPPQVALGIAMGAFRGLFVNYLWIRANNLKEEGKYYEAVDLAKTITKLQPRFPKVWQFHAWNLAYNVSVTTNTPQERWNWVQAGIRLLRHDGIGNCPTDLGIHRELAWIHLHKVQGYMDDAHVYYKRRFALEWSYVLGAPPTLKIEEMGTGKIKEAFIARWIQPIADAAESEVDLYSPEPLIGETTEQAQIRAKEAGALIAELKGRCGMDLDQKFLREYEILDATLRASEATGLRPPWVEQDPLAQLIAGKRFSGSTGKAVYNYTRKKVLRDEYRMDPRAMVKYMETFGPLDWRHPAAHAIYWSTRGVEETIRRVNASNKKDFDTLNTDRLTIQALQELFRTGDVTFDVLYPEFYLALPNTEYIDKYRERLDELVERSWADDPNRPYSFYWAGYQNFMLDAIRYLYRRGDVDAAKDYMRRLRDDKRLNTNDVNLVAKLSRGPEELVKDEIQQDNREDSPYVAMQEISGALYAAYVGGLLHGNTKVFASNFDYARLFHENYQKSKAFKTWISEASGNVGRMGFPPFEEWSAKVFAELINKSGTINGSIMYKRAPGDLQGATYVFIELLPVRQAVDQMEKQAGAPGFDVWFPPPSNVEMWRAKMIKPDQGDGKGNVELK